MFQFIINIVFGLSLASLLIGAVLYTAHRTHIFGGIDVLPEEDEEWDDEEEYDDDEEDYDDDDDEEEYDDDDDEGYIRNDDAAIRKLFPVPSFGPETLEIVDMKLRLTQPHVFRDDWYEEWRKDFSAWSRDEWSKIYAFEEEMGIIAS